MNHLPTRPFTKNAKSYFLLKNKNNNKKIECCLLLFCLALYELKHLTMLIYEGPAKSFVTGFGLLQCYVLSNIFLLQTFMWLKHVHPGFITC